MPRPVEASVTVLHSFAGGSADGYDPVCGLVLGGSTLYGATDVGGAFNAGTVFRIDTDGTGFSLLHQFGSNSQNDGAYPRGALHLSGATLFGTTAAIASTVFRVDTDGSDYSILHRFPLGTNPPFDASSAQGSLVLAGSSLYGTTSGGGTEGQKLYRVDTDGSSFSLVHSFTGGPANGVPGNVNGLTLGGTTLYGMTGSGGAFDRGLVYQIQADGTGFSILHTFTSFVGAPFGPDRCELALFGSKLFGLTRAGGLYGQGVVFALNSDGSGFQVLHDFNAVGNPHDGRAPSGSLALIAGSLYGTTSHGGASDLGTIFRIGTDGAGYSVVHEFAGGANDGARPLFGRLVGSGSTLYGSTFEGGAYDRGTVFCLTVPEPASAWLLIAGAAAGVCGRLSRKRRFR